MRSISRIIVAAAIALTVGVVSAQPVLLSPVTEFESVAPGSSVKVQFTSANKGTGIDLLYKGKVKYDDTISGELTLPASATGKVPAMVVMHGSGGLDAGSARSWASMLGQMGYATFLVDSFTPRGISGTGTDQSLLTYTTSGIDSLKALELLATHPRIDSGRIGVIGFSRGGVAAQQASFERFRSAVLPGTGLKFALHIALYGGCAQYGTTTGVPVLHLIGEDDGFLSVEQCRKVTDMTNARKGHVRLVAYPGALHGFDREEIRRQYIGNFQTWKDCRFESSMDDLTSQIPGKPTATIRELIDYRKSCMTRGIDYGGDSSAASKARKEVSDLLAKTLPL